jgi:hypothetical protein
VIPPFDERGCLPPGIHLATLAEVLSRCGNGSAEREAQAESLTWLVALCRKAGIIRLVLNGSFVTDVPSPNDVDCVLLQGPAYDDESPEAAELGRGLPFLELKIVEGEEFSLYLDIIFGTDRHGRPKGVVEVTQWT